MLHENLSLECQTTYLNASFDAKVSNENGYFNFISLQMKSNVKFITLKHADEYIRLDKNKRLNVA